MDRLATFALVSLVCVVGVPLGLPGTWLMLGLALLLETIDGSFLAGDAPQTFGWATLGVGAALAVVGEILEAGAGAAGTHLGGGTRRGMVGAIVGGLLGAILLTGLIPIPFIGTLIGAFVGTFAGALYAEATSEEARQNHETLKAAAGAALGRLAGTLGKTMLAVMIWVVLVRAAFVA